MAFQLLFKPRGITLEVAGRAPILSEIGDAGYKTRLSCRNGNCHICAGRLLQGRVSLKGAAVTQGSIVLCTAVAQSDCTIEIEELMKLDEKAIKTYSCKIESVNPLSEEVYQVKLLLPAGKLEGFYAGQYLALKIPGFESAYFSIASAPAGRALELHIQVSHQASQAREIVEYLQQKPSVMVEMPFGAACFSEVPDAPILLVAAGTGFAQMKSIVEWLQAQSFDRPIELYWGVRQAPELYMQALPQHWRQTMTNFRYVSVAGDLDDNDWTGHHDQLIEAVKADHSDLSAHQVVVSGSPAMVYALQDALEEIGLNPESLLSDVLEYAPREQK